MSGMWELRRGPSAMSITVWHITRAFPLIIFIISTISWNREDKTQVRCYFTFSYQKTALIIFAIIFCAAIMAQLRAVLRYKNRYFPHKNWKIKSYLSSQASIIWLQFNNLYEHFNQFFSSQWRISWRFYSFSYLSHLATCTYLALRVLRLLLLTSRSNRFAEHMKGSTRQIPQTSLVIWKKSTTTANGLFTLQATWICTGKGTSTIGRGPCPYMNISAYILEPIDSWSHSRSGQVSFGVSIPQVRIYHFEQYVDLT